MHKGEIPIFRISIEIDAIYNWNTFDMANCIEDVFIVCTVFNYVLLFMPNMDIAWKCSLHQTAVYNNHNTLLYMLRMVTAIGTICMPVFNIQRALLCNAIFGIHNNIQLNFAHSIKTLPIQFAICDIFWLYMAQISSLIVKTLYMWFYMWHTIMYKFSYKLS